jgi:tetratricopeptide (TPR) repeat protein
MMEPPSGQDVGLIETSVFTKRTLSIPYDLPGGCLDPLLHISSARSNIKNCSEAYVESSYKGDEMQGAEEHMDRKLRTIVLFLGGLSLGMFTGAEAQDRMSRAQAYESEMRWSEAFSEYVEILKRDPTNAQAHYRLGVVQAKLGATDEALRSYQEALRLHPGMSEARQALEGYYINQGIAFRRAHQSAEALQAFQQALTYNASSATAYFEIGEEYDRLGQSDASITAYQQAIALDPDKSAAHARLAAVYAKRGQPQQAAQQFQEVLRLNPQDPVAHHGLGVAYSELGQRDEAIASLQQAIRFYLIAGQRDKAQPAYELQKKLLAEKAAVTSGKKK